MGSGRLRTRSAPGTPRRASMRSNRTPPHRPRARVLPQGPRPEEARRDPVAQRRTGRGLRAVRRGVPHGPLEGGQGAPSASGGGRRKRAALRGGGGGRGLSRRGGWVSECPPFVSPCPSGTSLAREPGEKTKPAMPGTLAKEGERALAVRRAVLRRRPRTPGGSRLPSSRGSRGRVRPRRAFAPADIVFRLVLRPRLHHPYAVASPREAPVARAPADGVGARRRRRGGAGSPPSRSSARAASSAATARCCGSTRSTASTRSAGATAASSRCTAPVSRRTWASWSSSVGSSDRVCDILVRETRAVAAHRLRGMQARRAAKKRTAAQRTSADSRSGLAASRRSAGRTRRGSSATRPPGRARTGPSA